MGIVHSAKRHHPIYESQRNDATLRIPQLDLRQAGDLVRFLQERVVARGVPLVQEPAIPTALQRPTRDGQELFPYGSKREGPGFSARNPRELSVLSL
jgi:hypothetical protein